MVAGSTKWLTNFISNKKGTRQRKNKTKNVEKYDLYSELIGTFWIQTIHSKYGSLFELLPYDSIFSETDERKAAENP